MARNRKMRSIGPAVKGKRRWRNCWRRRPAAGRRNESPDSSPRLGAASPRDAISKALPRLYAGGREFVKRSGCMSCHHNMLQAIVYSAVRSRDIAVDAEEVRNNINNWSRWLNGNREGLFQDADLPGADTTSGYLLVALEAEGHPRDRATDALVHT